jgi:hypothetical protein
MRKKVVLLIPLTYNDGTAVPWDLLNSIHSELFAFAHGVTAAGKVKGSYRMADGTRQDDVLEQLLVVVEEDRIPALRKMVARYGRLLGQEKMWFEITESVIVFLPPEEGQDNE